MALFLRKTPVKGWDDRVIAGSRVTIDGLGGWTVWENTRDIDAGVTVA